MKKSFRYFIYLFVLCGIIRLSLTFFFYYYNFQLCDLEILVTAPEKCEVRGPKPQLLVFINFTLISHSELKINLDVHPSWVLSLLSSLIDIVVSTSLFR